MYKNVNKKDKKIIFQNEVQSFYKLTFNKKKIKNLNLGNNTMSASNMSEGSNTGRQ